MKRTSSKYKLLRYLILGLGFATVPTAAIAGAIATNEALRETQEANPAKDIEVQSDGGVGRPRELTFQFAPPHASHSTDGDAALTIDLDGDRAEERSLIAKKNKRHKNKKYKKCKKCGDIFFQSIIVANTQFTVVGEFTSEILIQIFEDEAAFVSGVPALGTIEYNSACYDTLVPGVELGTVTLSGYRGNGPTRELTFHYLSPDDSDYNNIKLKQRGTRGSFVGVFDDDDEAYIVVFDAKGGKRCKKYKKYKKSARSRDIFFAQTSISDREATEASNSSSETLIQILDDDPDNI